MRLLCALAVVTLMLSGCFTVTPIDPAKLPVAPATFREMDPRWINAVPAESQPRGEWWRVFADGVLEDLAGRANRGNASIQLAGARLAQARALVRASDANRAVQANAGVSVSRQGGPLINRAGAAGTLIDASANLSYEVDLFGRLAKASDAASLDAQSREALAQSTRLLVHADIAQNYFALRAVDAERAIVRDTLKAYRESLQLTERRFQAGFVAELDVARAQSEVVAVQSELLSLDRHRAELEHALALLAGEVASNFQIAETPWNTSLPAIPPGIPSAVLARRPDISAAQSALLAAQARLGVAQTAWFPNLALTANGGYAASDLGSLLRASAQAWGLSAFLALPIFDGGRRKAGVLSAEAEREAMVAGYREQILVAFRDVEDQLSSLRILTEQAEVQVKAGSLAHRVTELSESRYRSGLVSQLDLLDAQRNELRQKRQSLQVRLAQFQSTVALIKALGGGWDARPVKAGAHKACAAQPCTNQS